MRVSQINKVIPGFPHLEKCIVQDRAQQYCLKEDTRVEGPYEFGEKPFVKRNT